MNTTTRNLRRLSALLTIAASCLSVTLRAQTLTTVYSFTGGSDGFNPQSGLILVGSTLYGTVQGANGSAGGVYKVETNGTGFATLHGFTGGDDGGTPQSGVVLWSNMVFGVTPFGGTSTKGTVYGVGTNGLGFTTLFAFTGGNDGATPYGPLTLSGNTLYGTTTAGGAAGVGTVFAINTDGSGFRTVYPFTASGDGATPWGGLTLVGSTLYGTTYNFGYGTVFSVGTDGSGIFPIYTFSAGADGGGPYGGVVLSGATLYGTTHAAGGYGYGNVFSVNINGSGFRNLHDFSGGTSGAAPYAGLILSRGMLYGTSFGGGFAGNGTVFQISTNGTGFTNLYSFTGGADGANPWGGVILTGNTLYGTTYNGGASGNGSVFSLSLPPAFRPQLAIAHRGTNVILTWTTNATGFALQSTPSLAAPATWTTVATNPPIVSGQYTVTNPITGSRLFYRLIQ